MTAKGMKFDVVGINHRLLPGTQRLLERLIVFKPLKCELQREPRNTHDSNAIKVNITDPRLEDFREFPKPPVHIGYIRRGTAAVLASGFDAGRLKVKVCRLVSIDTRHGEGQVQVAFLKSPASKP
jgi:hypothetical protein